MEDHIKLEVDHRLPLAWGGTDEIENLQPLCEECNAGKQAWYSSHVALSENIAAALKEDEVHRRIGEFLKAANGEWVPSDLIGIVASAGRYQEDWQKRMRELRVLGWVIESRREHTLAKTFTFYRAAKWTPWPHGQVRRAISAAEAPRKKQA